MIIEIQLEHTQTSLGVQEMKGVQLQQQSPWGRVTKPPRKKGSGDRAPRSVLVIANTPLALFW